MPNRIIREGILSSDRVEQLDPAAEVFYRRLMSKVDDHGLYDARLSVLRSSLYPLRVDRVREADCSRWIAACEKAGLIALTKSLGKELAQSGVLVNCVTPAAAKTAIFDQMTEAQINYMLSKIPMGRFVQVDEIAALVAWLMSADCSFSTGGVFDITGGRATY